MKRPMQHYSTDPLYFRKDWRYSQSPFPAHKPEGFWLSDESDYGWPQFCHRENFRALTLAHKTTFIVDLSHVLWLRDTASLSAFTQNYGEFHGLLGWLINWKAVAADYFGVLITPYIKFATTGEKLAWYEGWDCASGCFWNLSCLTTLEYQTIGEHLTET